MAEEYGTAGYLAEPHPDDPVAHPLMLWVVVAFCKRCGAIVHDKNAHDAFHHNLKVGWRL